MEYQKNAFSVEPRLGKKEGLVVGVFHRSRSPGESGGQEGWKKPKKGKTGGHLFNLRVAGTKEKGLYTGRRDITAGSIVFTEQESSKGRGNLKTGRFRLEKMPGIRGGARRKKDPVSKKNGLEENGGGETPRRKTHGGHERGEV